MLQESCLSEFIDFIKEVCDAGKTGVVTFFVEAGGWGKIQIHAGQVQQLRYGTQIGEAALSHLATTPKLRYALAQFGGEIDSQHSSSAIPIGNEKFFHAFDLAISYKSGPSSGIEIIPSAKPASPAIMDQQRKPKVLVADDSRVARACLVRLLVQAGYAVVEAASGFEVLSQMENESPNLLILDLIMPGIDGYKVLDHLRHNPRYHDFPVLILTSRDSLLDKLRGKMSNSNEYLTKPVDPDRLLTTLERYLPKDHLKPVNAPLPSYSACL